MVNSQDSNSPSAVIDFDWNGWNDPLNPFVLAGGTLVWNGPGSMSDPIVVDSSPPNSPCGKLIVAPLNDIHGSGDLNLHSNLSKTIKSKLLLNKFD